MGNALLFSLTAVRTSDAGNNGEFAFHNFQDVKQADFLRIAVQEIAALGAALGNDKTGLAQGNNKSPDIFSGKAL